MLADAELTDVCFADADQGWAVGDKGVIVHSDDGGRNWELQSVPTSCRLEAVQFLDPQIGWVVGGRVHPYTHHTSGVVLRTTDGGTTWKQVPDLTLPALKAVRFVNARQGWALGNPCALYPTGIFRTEDGGQTWTTLPGGIRGRWTAGDFRDAMRGVVVGHDGQMARIAVPAVELIDMANTGPGPLRAVRFSTDTAGWLAGDGGLLLNTTNGGNSWQAPPQPVPAELARLLDFRALDVQGDHVWVAGAPGSCVSPFGRRGQDLERVSHRPVAAAQRRPVFGRPAWLGGGRDGDDPSALATAARLGGAREVAGRGPLCWDCSATPRPPRGNCLPGGPVTKAI